MSETPADKKEAPAPVAPALGELFELAFTALVNAPGVFARLAARPSPRAAASLLVALAWGASYFALNLIHVAVAEPAMLQSFAPWKIAAVGVFGLGIWTALYLLGASLVFALGKALGSEGDFDRALLLAAVALAAAPVQALCSWFPMAWTVPALLAAWIASCGFAALFKADPWAARGVCAAFAAGVLALQYGAGLVVEKYAATAKAAAAAAQAVPSADQLADLQKQMQQVQALAVDATQQASQAAAPQGQSSLDLLRGPEGTGPTAAGPTQAQQLAQMSAAGDAMNKSVLGMLDSMAPMLNNPAITQNMSLQQKSDYAELKGLIATLRSDMATGKRTSDQEQQARMLKIQQMTMRLMSAGMTMPKPSAPEPPK